MPRKKVRIPGLSFSWKRALGISGAKARLSRQLGIPLTRSGRQRKLGRALGCSIIIAITAGMIASCGAAMAAVMQVCFR